MDQPTILTPFQEGRLVQWAPILVGGDYSGIANLPTIIVDTTQAPITIELPDADGSVSGQVMFLKNIGTNVLTIAAAAGETIDGAATVAISTQWQSVAVVRDPRPGLGWLTFLGGGGGGGGGTAPSISSFTNSVGSVEIGVTVSSTVLNWILAGGAITSQSINQGIGSLSIALRTATDSSSYTTDRTYTLTVSDGTTTVQRSTSVSFLNKIYWGANASSALNNAGILALGGQALSSSFTGFNQPISPAGQYLYVCYPTSFGVAQVFVDGFLDTSWVSDTVSLTNASGHTSNYYRLHSQFQLTGNYRVSLQ